MDEHVIVEDDWDGIFADDLYGIGTKESNENQRNAFVDNFVALSDEERARALHELSVALLSDGEDALRDSISAMATFTTADTVEFIQLLFEYMVEE